MSSHRRRFVVLLPREVVVARALLDDRVRLQAHRIRALALDKPTSSVCSLVASDGSYWIDNPNLKYGHRRGMALTPPSRSNTKFNTSFACMREALGRV